MSLRSLLPLIIGGVLSFCVGGFSDVPTSHWATPSLKELTEIGVLDISSDKFEGNNPIRRYDMAVLLAKYHRYIQEHFGSKPTPVSLKSTSRPDELARQVSELASSVAIIDDLRDQFDALKNDVTYLNVKESRSAFLTPQLFYRGQAVLSNSSPDTLVHSSKISFKEENSAYSIDLGLSSVSNTTNTSLLLQLSASTEYIFPFLGVTGLSIEKGPGEQTDSLGQILDFKKDRIRVSVAQNTLQGSIDLISSNRSILSLGAQQRFAVNEHHYLEAGWNKRYAYAGRLSGIFGTGGILDQKDILFVKIMMGNYAVSGRMAFGGDEYYSLSAEVTGISVLGSVVTSRLLTLAPKGILSQMADTYHEIGAIDIFGLPIENNSSYLSLRVDRAFESFFGAVDRKSTPSGNSYKALAGILFPIRKGLISQMELRAQSGLSSSVVLSALWTLSLSI